MTPSKRSLERRINAVSGEGKCDHPLMKDVWRDCLLDPDDPRRDRTEKELDAAGRAMAECPNCRNPFVENQ